MKEATRKAKSMGKASACIPMESCIKVNFIRVKCKDMEYTHTRVKGTLVTGRTAKCMEKAICSLQTEMSTQESLRKASDMVKVSSSGWMGVSTKEPGKRTNSLGKESKQTKVGNKRRESG